MDPKQPNTEQRTIPAPRVCADLPMPECIRAGNAEYLAKTAETGERPLPVFAADYPVEGGWGYSQEDACIIKMKGPMEDKSIPLVDRDFYSVESLFVKRRIIEELYRHPGHDLPQLTGFDSKMLRQTLCDGDGGRKYDNMRFRVSFHLQKDWDEIQEDYRSHGGYKDNPDGLAMLDRRVKEKELSYETEYWFDITSSFGGVKRRKSGRSRVRGNA